MPRAPVCVDASIVVALVTAEAQSERVDNCWRFYYHLICFAPRGEINDYELQNGLRPVDQMGTRRC